MTSCKLCKAEKFSQVRSNSSLLLDTKRWKFSEQKNIKNNKASTCFKRLCKYLQCWDFNSFNPELQLKDIESVIRNKLKKILTELREFKLLTALVLPLKKIESEDKTKDGSFYLEPKSETIINESEIADNVFKSIYTTVLLNIQKILRKSSGWIIDSVIEHDSNI